MTLRDQIIEAMALAMGTSAIGYHLKLVSLIDDKSIYSLTYEGEPEVLSFCCYADARAQVKQRFAIESAKAALAAICPLAAVVPRNPSLVRMDMISDGSGMDQTYIELIKAADISAPIPSPQTDGEDR